MSAGSQVDILPTCPSNVHWSNDGLERDLYITTTTVTVLAMDGRKRWLDIHKLVSFAILSYSENMSVCSFIVLYLSVPVRTHPTPQPQQHTHPKKEFNLSVGL